MTKISPRFWLQPKSPGLFCEKALGQFFDDTQTAQVWFNFHASWYVPWIGTEGGICVAGGLDHNSQLSKHTQCYDLASGTFN
ncbi:hypothetical protein GF380_04735, partial [Candidatus Uhrbacteria bacterium]|nr:hypothetical protein [Candidatus Uhrbacteria bacterium]